MSTKNQTLTIEPGKTYLQVTCSNPDCQMGIAFQEIQPGQTHAELPETIPLSCPKCGHKDTYRREQVRRGQGQYKH